MIVMHAINSRSAAGPPCRLQAPMLKLYAEVHALLDVFEQPKHFVHGTSFQTSFCKSRNNTRHISEDAPERSNPLIVIQVAGHLAAKKFTEPAACL